MMDAAKPVIVMGSYLLPFVCKVLDCLAMIIVDYGIDQLVPFYGNEEISRISPMRRIPVLLTACPFSPVASQLSFPRQRIRLACIRQIRRQTNRRI